MLSYWHPVEAGPCQEGYYCPNGTLLPIPCPDNTMKNYTGGYGHVSDCTACYAGKVCVNGTAFGVSCPRGKYCLRGQKPIDCPVHRYRDIPGGVDLDSCFPCPAGHWCNLTGMVNYNNSKCPIGHFCPRQLGPTLCGAGRRRVTPGAGSREECEFCPGGYYCPNDTINVQGIPCKPTTYCPVGSSLELLCPGGSYCPGKTSQPIPCPGGFYCPSGSQEPTDCKYPNYCPPNSTRELPCKLGYQALDNSTSKLRVYHDDHCQECVAGTYGNHPQRLFCGQCPAGFFCPNGTKGPFDNLCPEGAYCPAGVGEAQACPPGTYGNRSRATKESDCFPCPANTFNNLENQRACLPCGSSSVSAEGQTLCTCLGQSRSFQSSDGACVCLLGYVFDDPSSREREDGDSDLDCRPMDADRCPSGEVRRSSDWACVNLENENAVCSQRCKEEGETGGGFNSEYGTCICTHSTECNKTCEDDRPKCSVSRNSDGGITLSCRDNATESLSLNLSSASGLNNHDEKPHDSEFVVFGSNPGAYIPQSNDNINEVAGEVPNRGQSGRRRRRRAVGDNSTTAPPGLTISNPILCLDNEKAVVFRVEINPVNRSLSHYPRYRKNHLLNTNDRFDYGNFRQLHSLVQESSNILTHFVHVFTQSGTFVFYDNADPNVEVIITVKDKATKCAGVLVAPITEGNLRSAGVKNSEPLNLKPDWGVIWGMTVFMLVCIIMLVIAVIIWRPKSIERYSVRALRPKYTALGAPVPVVPIPGIDDNVYNLGPRGSPEGASFDSPSVRFELENFSVRTLYDKLEDQTLHVSSQLARHQSDLRAFYDRISQQAEKLKGMLDNMDVSALIKATKEAGKARPSESSIENHQESGVGKSTERYGMTAGGQVREQELMASLQMLLEKVEKGQLTLGPGVISGASISIPSSSKMVIADGTGAASSTVIQQPFSQTLVEVHAGEAPSMQWQVQGTNDVSEFLRKMNAERMHLEQQLGREEETAVHKLLKEQEETRAEKIKALAGKLADKLSAGDLTEDEMKAIMEDHHRQLSNLEGVLEAEKDRQAAALREKLRRRREEKEAELLRKQKEEAAKANIRLDDVPPLIKTDTLLKTQEGIQDVLVKEESTGYARAEEQLSSEEAESYRRQMGDKFCAMVDDLVTAGSLYADQAEQIKREQMELEEKMSRELAHQRAQQAALIKDKLAQRKKERMRKLKEQQELQKAKGISEGEDVEALVKQQEGEMAALEATLEAEETRHMAEISKKLDEEHKENVHQAYRALFDKVTKDNLDAVLQQQIMDQFRKDNEALQEHLEQRKQKSLEDTKAKLAARRARRQEEARRQSEKSAGQRILEEQSQAIAANRPVDADHVLVPEVIIPRETEEEVALRNEQERTLADMRSRHEEDTHKLNEKLERELAAEEDQALELLDAEKGRRLRELKERHAAELAARSKEMSPEEVHQLLATHQQEVDEIMEKIDIEKQRQQANLHKKLMERKKRKQEAQKRKQEREMAKELLEQQKELTDVRSEHIKQAEKQAMIEGIRENGSEAAEFVIKKVLAKRQSQELKDLESMFQGERKVAVDEALAKMEERHAQENDELRALNEKELKELEKQKLSPEELQQKRAQLLNQQQLRQSSLDKKHADERKQIQNGVVSDWEIRFARAKLELKEKHYQEYADALNELTPEQAEEHRQSVEKALAAARELEVVKKRLDEQRLENEEKLRQENEAFEADQERKLHEQLQLFDKQLEEEAEQEQKKNEKTILALNARKEALLKEKKAKVKQEIDKMSKQGASKEEQEAILKEHSKDLAKLMNKMDADRMRMQSSLEERLKKRREAKRKAKVDELTNQNEEEKREFEEKIQSERDRAQAEEVMALKESIHVDKLVSAKMESEAAPPPAPQAGTMPDSYRLAAPLSEGELASLLLSSPLYQKIEGIKSLLSGGAGKGGASYSAPAPGEGYIDIKDDTLWGDDDELVPVDLNTLPSRAFITYKFGSFVVDLLAVHCHHLPVTLLLADKLPSNTHLQRNAYRNSFFYDANNRILYVRAERMDNVGEFVLVLVHCLSHIACGDLRDDAHPGFLKEFHHALAVVCDDLFFARYRRTSALARTLSSLPADENLESASRMLLESVFGDAHTEADKSNVVEGLLDAKLLRGANKDGVHFTNEGIVERLGKYSNFVVESKLRSFLGDVEDKATQARLQGTEEFIDNRLHELQGARAKDRPMSRYVQSRGNLMSRQMSRAMATSRTATGLPISGKSVRPSEDEDLYKTFLQVQVDDMADTVDALNQEFAQLSRQSIDTSTNLRGLEQELLSQTDLLRESAEGSTERAQHKNAVRETTTKITTAKASLESIELQRSNCLERLNLFKKKLEEKQAQLDQHVRKPQSERMQQAERKLQSAMGKSSAKHKARK